SPTRTNARPGCTPRILSSPTRAESSRRICAATARPSMLVLDGGGWDGIGIKHVDALDGDDWRVWPALVKSFRAGDDDPHVDVAVQIKVRRSRVKIINDLERGRVV